MSGRVRPIMPRPSFPPTPAPSTDISGKPGATAAQFDASFSLPPAALGATGSRGSTSSSAASNASDSSYRPLSPTSPAATAKPAPASRKRSSTKTGGIITKDDYSLPPPPTRSRKIIQMQPKESQEPPPAASTSASASTKAAPAAASGGKKKQAGPNTAQGRKIARKTAHSLIERRRRSKMNEEFGVLKDMIPACAGQEMHKLAILQASIDYMRYLEQCVADLKASHRSRESPSPISPKQGPPPPSLKRSAPEDDDDDEDEDEDMEDAVSPTQVANAAPKRTYEFADVSPAIYPTDQGVHSTTTSPNLYPTDRQYSATASPAIHPSDPRHYSLASSIRSTVTSPSIQASPAFGGHTPSQSQFHNPFSSAASGQGSISSAPGGAHFALTSPALGPQAEREDHEATEALLMLNTDRRSWSDKDPKRGISVNDLLSR